MGHLGVPTLTLRGTQDTGDMVLIQVGVASSSYDLMVGF